LITSRDNFHLLNSVTTWYRDVSILL